MNRTLTILLAVCLVLGLGSAEAGQRDRNSHKAPPKGKRTEMPETWTTARYDHFPTMSYTSGRVQQNGLRGWKVGDIELILKKDTVIMMDGSRVEGLQSGRDVVVMGSLMGNTMVVWSARILPHDYSDPTPSTTFTREPGPNPNVGVLKGLVE